MRGGHRVRHVRARAGVWGWIVAGLLLALLGGALWWMLAPAGSGRPSMDTAKRDGNIPPGEELNLWFVSRQEDALVLEKRRAAPSQTPVERVKAVLQELIAGPKGPALPTVPADVKVREVFIDGQGTAYLDFSEALSRANPVGPWAEMLTLRSIVQTLMANVPEIKRVQILIEGREMETLAGHMDIRRPLDTTWMINQR
jgi:spore germination protein GerM